MMVDCIDKANECVQSLSPYVPGKPIEEVQRELGIKDVIKLASNENPLGPSPLAIKAAAEMLSQSHIYPDGNGFHIKHALSQRFNVTPDMITMGAGSDNLLALIAQTFLEPGKEAVISQYAFATFSIVVKGHGGTPVITPAKEWGHDLSAMLNAITERTRVMFIANPNNPTGTYIKVDELRAFLKNVPEHIMVVLDEAYYEFACEHDDYPNSLQLLQDFPNVIITRTFSKTYGLAGLRVGYSFSSPEVSDLLNRVRLPFNVNLIADAAAQAALKDENHLQKTIEINTQGLKQVYKGLDDIGLNYIPSVCNFVAVDVKLDGLEVYQGLLEQGVIVRPMAAYKLPHHLRISIGTQQENERMLNALQKTVGK